MPRPTSKVPRAASPLKGRDLAGLARLGVDATLGVTDLVERMHHTIASFTGIAGRAPAGRPRGITGVVYSAVRGTTRLVGKGLQAALGLAATEVSAHAAGPQREALVAALNGIWGDHLLATNNPLAIPMSLRMHGQALDLASDALTLPVDEPSGRLLVLVHGLCMNDLQWTREGHNHGHALAHDLGFTPVYLHYNTGLHVSHNGREFSALLERLVATWPVPVTELAIVGHSMGGLVTRSACHVAAQDGAKWLRALTRMVCLGTPHHGAPLERGGRLVDAALGLSPYVAPFSRLARARSAGITDLRYGNLQDADWQGRTRHSQRHDDRRITPLPAGVAVHLLAATTADQPSGVKNALLGDGLVPVASALGEHSESARTLDVPAARRKIITACNHLDLLNHPAVYAQLRSWLGGLRRRAAA